MPVASSGPTPTPPSLPSLLGQAIEQVAQLGEEFHSTGQKLQDLRTRLAEERFHLAVLGQFKRGKSTLLNALLGQPVLPTSVVPLTAIPTFLLPANTLRVHVVYHNGQPPQTFTPPDAAGLTTLLARFVTEEGNPHNRRNVAQVEVFHPAPLLRRGVVLIDTPGIGSTFRHNTQATLNFLPQCDAALFLVSADPPLTEVEVEFLKEVRSKVTHLFFILNKVDYLTPAERQAALSFLRKVLQEQAGLENPGPIFCVSARQGLAARQQNDSQLWERSGLAALEKHLLHFLISDKTKILQSAVAHKAADRLAGVLMQLRLTIRSLQLPLADLDERLRLFEQTLTEAERQRRIAHDLLAGDHKRLAALLEEQAEQLRRRARDHFNRVVQDALAQSGEAVLDEKVAQDALAEAIPGFFERELGEMARMFEQRVQETLDPHRQRADELVETVRRAAAELFEVTYQPLDSHSAFPFERQPYWVTHHWRTTLSPFSPQWTDRFLPRRLQQARRWKRLQHQIEALVIQNVENLRWATRQNLDQAIRRFSSRLDERLQETGAATQNAIRAARQQRQAQAASVTATVARLEAAAGHLEQLQAGIQTFYGLP
ncbi:MAG: Dynamin family protein [Caldilineae bacterium]|nr:MAG: Dynamin family protein [Caldilineae bacterium]